MNISKKNSFRSRYWNNELYTDEDENIAQKVSNSQLDESWIDVWNKIDNLTNKLNSKSDHPIKKDSITTYYDYLLSTIIPIHEEPPSSITLFDKIFKTQRYKDYQNREIIIKDNQRFHKIRKLVNYLRLEKLKLEEKQIERETKLQMQSAFIKSKLFHNFISIINKKDSNKNALIPNAIMLEGQNRTENIKTIKWMIERSDTAYTYLDYDPEKYGSSVNFLAQIESALEKAQDNYKKTNGQRTILYINNFDLLIQKGMDTSDLKNLIQELNNEYKTTLVFETPDSSKLDPVALQDHRFGLKCIINENIDPKTFNKLEFEFFKANTSKILNSDGYRFNYIPGREKYIDLFLGAFGYDKTTLWLEGKDIVDIDIAFTFINSIKKLKKFNEITKIRTSSDSTIKSDLLVASGFKPINQYTIEKRMIYEKTI